MTVNSYVSKCPECGEHTCLNNVNTRPRYHNLECWSCGWYSIADTGFMDAKEREELRQQMEGY